MKLDALPQSVPACVGHALQEAEELYRIVIEAEFPELPESIESLDDAVDAAVQSMKWGERIHEAHEGVVRLFPGREQGVSVQLPGDLLQNLYFSRTELTPLEGRTERRMPSFDLASDVISPIPAKYSDCMVWAFPLGLGGLMVKSTEEENRSEDEDRDRFPRILTKATAYRIALERNWEDLTPAIIRQWATVVRIKCLGLVAWLRASVREIGDAVLPTFTWRRSRAYHGQIIELSMAGASRLVDLKGAEHDLLNGLSTGAADCFRGVRADLLKKIPELTTYVSCERTLPENRGRYRVPPEIADRIDVGVKRAGK